MQAAKRALVRAERVVDLTEMTDEIVLAEFLLAKRAREKAPLISFLFELDQICARRAVWQ